MIDPIQSYDKQTLYVLGRLGCSFPVSSEEYHSIVIEMREQTRVHWTNCPECRATHSGIQGMLASIPIRILSAITKENQLALTTNPKDGIYAIEAKNSTH